MCAVYLSFSDACDNSLLPHAYCIPMLLPFLSYCGLNIVCYYELKASLFKLQVCCLSVFNDWPKMTTNSLCSLQILAKTKVLGKLYNTLFFNQSVCIVSSNCYKHRIPSTLKPSWQQFLQGLVACSVNSAEWLASECPDQHGPRLTHGFSAQQLFSKLTTLSGFELNDSMVRIFYPLPGTYGSFTSIYNSKGVFFSRLNLVSKLLA